MSLSTVVHGTGHPIVVLPGLGLDANFTAAVTEPALSAHRGHRRTYVSLPGGGSPNVCEPSSDAILDVLTDWVGTEFGGDDFSLLGHSYGGYLAMGLAGRLRARVRRLLLVCSGVKIDAGRRDLSGVSPPDVEAGWLDECPAVLRDHLGYAVGRQHHDVGARLAVAFAGAVPADDEFIGALQQQYQLSGEQSLLPLEQPVTFVAGRRDRVVGFRDAFAASLGCPRGSYVLVAEAGHYLPAETPEKFSAAVTHWLS